MPTKCTIIGESPEENKKPIEFVKVLDAKKLLMQDTRTDPGQWGNIELIARSNNYDMDLMFAYDSDRNNGYLYFGH